MQGVQPTGKTGKNVFLKKSGLKNWKKDNKFQVGAGKTGNVKCQIFPLNFLFSNTRCQKDFNDIAEHKILYNIFIYAVYEQLSLKCKISAI